ncbi:T9SS type A sorting domain-containing protein [Candidatus Poribacteria bacterium]|nr:T9SS type A sorting domain-containing protein [Candidatus Poribacteria bacterium]
MRENDFGIYCAYQANPAIHFNNIEKNSSYGVYNSDCSVTVDAINNWWGDATGPFHPVNNPGGLGNPVSDCVIFDPWLPSPVSLLAAAPQAVAHFSLRPSYPNPGNPESWLPYSLADETDVTIRIYNASGQLVRTLDLGLKPAGSYFTKEKAAYWDGRDSLGQKVASGVYFYQLKAGEFTATRKMVILK